MTTAEAKRAYMAKWYANNRERLLPYWRERDRRTRLAALSYYSGGSPRCACCGEAAVEFLAIDHIDGGGRAHRARIGGGGNRLYRWLCRMGYPNGYRVLCHNCNQAIGLYGACPHASVARLTPTAGALNAD